MHQQSLPFVRHHPPRLTACIKIASSFYFYGPNEHFSRVACGMQITVNRETTYCYDIHKSGSIMLVGAGTLMIILNVFTNEYLQEFETVLRHTCETATCFITNFDDDNQTT